MSFLKISKPVKRDLIVKEYLETKKNIGDNLLSERTGEQELQTDLSKFYKPITEMQKATAREITEGLRPIREGIECNIKAKSHKFSRSGHKHLYHKFHSKFHCVWSSLSENEYRSGKSYDTRSRRSGIVLTYLG